MTDATTPAGHEPEEAQEPGGTENAEPLTDSTDGGLEGGDPGVEE